MIGAQHVDVDGRTYWSTDDVAPAPVRRPMVRLLPIYDEYLVAYRDRDVAPHGPSTMGWLPRGVNFRHALVIDGQVAGTWDVAARAKERVLEVTLLRKLGVSEQRALEREGARYARFIGGAVSTAVR